MQEQDLITGAQIRMARGLLKWSTADLAEKSGVSISTIKRLESNLGLSTSVTIANNQAVRNALKKSNQVRFERNACFYIGKDA